MGVVDLGEVAHHGVADGEHGACARIVGGGSGEVARRITAFLNAIRETDTTISRSET